jgi:hypothetical protein
LGIDAGGPESHPLPTQPAGQGVTNPGNFGARFSPYPSTGGGSFFSGPLPLLGPTLSVPDRAWRAGHAGANFNMIANCQQVDPILGALEFTFKLGPEIEVGPVKAGFSFYKNATTGEKGVTIEANAGLASIQAEQQTPQGGFVNGGSFEDFTRTASFMATQYDFRSGQVTPKPTKSFRGGLQAVLGIEVAFNPETAKRVARSNIACKALRGE